MKHRLRSVELDSLCNIEYGTRVTRKKDAGTKYPVYGGGGKTFNIDKFNRENVFIVSRFAMSEHCTRFVPGKFFLNDSGLSLTAKKEYKLLNEFLGYQLLLRSKDIYNLGRGTAQKNLDVKNFKKMKFKITDSLDEQKRIVKKLDTCMEQIDKAIKNVEQNIQNAENLFQSYLNEIFSKFDKSLIVDLSQLADIVSGQSPKSSNYNVDKKGLPFYQGKKLFNDKFISKPNTWTTHTTKVSIGGDILMSVRAPVGDVNINSVGEICIGRGLAAIRPNELLNREFLFYFLVYFKDKLSFNTGATINSINRKQISQIGVPKIELHEQSKIAENINLFEKNLYQSIKNYGNEILALNELKQSILEKAFNGEL